MSRLTDLNTRHTRYTKGEIAIHDNFDEGNAPYKAFQMSENFYTDTRKGGQKVYEGNTFFTLTSWEATVRSYWYNKHSGKRHDGSLYYPLTTDGDLSFCKNYSEKNDKSDKGLWRTPNQREMMLMYIQDKSYSHNTLSRTKWRYEAVKGVTRFFCANENLYLSNPADQTASFRLRCVRDVDIVK